MYLFASLGSALQAAGETAAAFPVTSTILGVLAAIAGLLKMIGIGPTQYHLIVGKLIAWLATKIPGDTAVETVGLNTVEQLLDALIDRLLQEEVAESDVKAIFDQIAPAVQKARLERSKRAVNEKCSHSGIEPSLKSAAPPTTATVEAL